MKVSIKSIFLILTIALLGFTAGCDPNHRKKCEWYLVPEPESTYKPENGFIPVCARNYSIKRQNCRLKAKLDFAKNAWQKRFRLVDMQVSKQGKFPRQVTSIKFCN